MSADTIKVSGSMNSRDERDEFEFIGGEYWGNWKDKIHVVWFGTVQLALLDFWLRSVVVDDSHGGMNMLNSFRSSVL